MANRQLRVYADTSVFGGVLDPEFSAPSKKFFDEVAAGRSVLAFHLSLKRSWSKPLIRLKASLPAFPNSLAKWRSPAKR